jgi:hypothetical protein
MVAQKGKAAHINAARQRVWRKAHLETELVDSFLETSVATENDLILEQSG